MQDNPHRHTSDISYWKYGTVVYYAAIVILCLVAVSGFLLGDIPRARWGLVAIAIGLIPAIAEHLTPVVFPWLMKFAIVLSLTLHMESFQLAQTNRFLI